MGWKDDPVVTGNRPRWESDPIVASAGSVSAIGPVNLVPSANPYSAGRYPLGRKFSVGDQATYDLVNLYRDVVIRRYVLQVTAVSEEADQVFFNDGKAISDLMGNFSLTGEARYDLPVQLLPNELYVGNKWKTRFLRVGLGGMSHADYDLVITGREKVAVPAGEFHAFRIEGNGVNRTYNSQLRVRIWVVPGLNFTVKFEKTERGPRVSDSEASVLVSFKQNRGGGV
jgi:hypothetical protein